MVSLAKGRLRMILRTFKTLRTAHLVLLEKCESGMLVYRESSYDFDANLLARGRSPITGPVSSRASS